jgi:hypothetical protein
MWATRHLHTELQGLLEMRISGMVFHAKHFGVITWLMMAFSWLAPSASGEQKCTHIRIELNGTVVSAPRNITFLETKGGTHIMVRVKDGCFRLPKALRYAESIDVILQVEGDNIHLTGRRPSDFAVRWNLVLKDHATHGPFAAFDNVPAREICVVEFDPGGDGTAVVQTGCRSAMKTNGSPSAPPLTRK